VCLSDCSAPTRRRARLCCECESAVAADPAPPRPCHPYPPPPPLPTTQYECGEGVDGVPAPHSPTGIDGVRACRPVRIDAGDRLPPLGPAVHLDPNTPRLPRTGPCRRRVGTVRTAAAVCRHWGCVWVWPAVGVPVVRGYPPGGGHCVPPARAPLHGWSSPSPLVVLGLTLLHGGHIPAPVRVVDGCPPGELESGVRTALALLVAEIQHSQEYRKHQASAGLHTPHPVRGCLGGNTQKIMGTQLTATARHGVT
jgi:hypothetical protein